MDKDRITKQERDADAFSDIIEGRNPVMELLNSGRDINKLFVANDTTGSIGAIVRRAKERNAVIVMCDRRKLDKMSKTGAHQGVIARAAAYAYAEISDMFDLAKERGEAPFFVICDGITDDHNLGAIIRSVEVSGAHGVILQKHGSALLNSVSMKASAGAALHVPVARVSNLAQTIEMLKKQDVWLYSCAPGAASDIYETDFTGACALVIGAEGAGVSRLISEKCDFSVRIPMRGKISSLNASVAAAIVLFEAQRQRMSAQL